MSIIRTVAVCLAAVGCHKEPSGGTGGPTPTGPTGTTPPAPQVVAVGAPMWQVADLVLFTGPAGATTEQCLLDGPHAWDGSVWSPGEPHDPPYGAEIRDGLQGCGLAEGKAFQASDIQDGRAVWLGLILEPKPGNAPGSSPDFPLGDVIYFDRFPLVVDADVRRDDLIVDADNDFIYPGPDTWGFVVTGLSHVPLLFHTTHERMPAGASPDGDYLWQVTLRDATSVVEDAGYDISVPYAVAPGAE